MPDITNSISSNFFITLKRDFSNTQFNLKSVNTPNISFGMVEVPWMITKVKVPGESVTFEPLQFEVILDKEWRVFTELYDDLILGADVETGIIQPSKKIFNLAIVITSNKNNPIIRFDYFDAFITNFGDIQLDITSDMLFMPVTAEYKYYKPTRLN